MSAVSAEAAFIRFESEVNSQGNVLAFHNHPTSAFDIVRITVYLGINTAFGTTAPVSSSPSNPITIAHFTPA